MDEKIKDLLDDFKNELSPIKKDIFTFVVHGSSVYSEKLKPHQDIDLFIVFKKMDFDVLKKFREILDNFTKKKSFGDEEVYYSVAGAGRGPIEKISISKSQIFRLEIFIDYEREFKYHWKGNSSFPHSLCKNYLILIGEDIKNYLPYVGDSENKILFQGFDKFQWSCCSIIEGGLSEEVIFSSIQDSVFYDLSILFLAYGINENRKDFMIERFKKEFNHDYKKYSPLLRETFSLRKGSAPKITKEIYFNTYKKFNKFVKGKVYEKLREN